MYQVWEWMLSTHRPRGRFPECERGGGQVSLPAASSPEHALLAEEPHLLWSCPRLNLSSAKFRWQQLEQDRPLTVLGQVNPMGIYVLVRTAAIPAEFFHVLFHEKCTVVSSRGQRSVSQSFLAADTEALWLPGALANGRRVELMGLLATASP